jgi:hypothetical protein
MTAPLLTLTVYFRRPDRKLASVETLMRELFAFCTSLGELSPLLAHWYLASAKSKDDALLYPAFDASGPTTAALAVLNAKNKNVKDILSASLWNGANATDDGASITSTTTILGLPESVTFRMTANPEIDDWHVAANLMQRAMEIWPAGLASLSPFWYSEKKVFKDKPGVGWMLYLPQILTQQDVPEARALVPVQRDGQQVGTILVSVTDAAFSLDNAEHVRIANEIEMRLVNQDMLPRVAEL